MMNLRGKPGPFIFLLFLSQLAPGQPLANRDVLRTGIGSSITINLSDLTTNDFGTHLIVTRVGPRSANGGIMAIRSTQAWQLMCDGPANRDDGAMSLAVAPNDNVIVTGRSMSEAGGYGYVTLSLTATNGRTQWIYRWPGNESGFPVPAMALDSIGNVVISAPDAGAILTKKLDSHGQAIWTNSLPIGLAYNGPRSFVTTDSQGNVYVAAPSDLDILTVRYNADGSAAWTNRFNGPFSGSDLPHAIACTSNGLIYVTGLSQAPGYVWDVVTLAYNSAGALLWSRRYVNPREFVGVNASAVDSSGNLFLAGYSFDPVTDYDFRLIKSGSDGTDLAQISYNGPASSSDFANAIVVDRLGQFYVTGS